MKAFITFCRIIAGSTFIVSGLVKANDALGFSYKLEEYFSEKALGMEYMMDYVLPLSVFIVIGEILLGVATLLGALPKLTSSLLFGLTLFFAWLTFYTATCDPYTRQEFKSADGKTYMDLPECVTSCGCFGDALKLTPWESFTKDIVLMVFVIPVFFAAWRKKISLNTMREDVFIGVVSFLLILFLGWKIFDWVFPAFFAAVSIAVAMGIKKIAPARYVEWAMALGVLVVCGIFQWWTLHYLPIKDYRAYAIGENLIENMKTAEEVGKEPPKFLTFYTLKNASTGETKEVDSDTYLTERLWEDTAWEIQKEFTYSKKVKEGYEPKIADFTALDFDGNELKDSLMSIPRLFLVLTYDLAHTDTRHMAELKAFTDAAMADGAVVFGMTTAGYDDCENLRHEFQLAFPYIQGDEKVLKTMIRANPGIMLLENGVVKGKWNASHLPPYPEIKQ